MKLITAVILEINHEIGYCFTERKKFLYNM